MLLPAWPACACLVSLLIPVALSGVEVRGTTACPTADEVSTRITPLLSADASLPAGERIELRDVVSTNGDATREVEVRLIREGATQPLGVRRVPGGSSCSETAEAAAVVAASWIGSYSTRPAPPPFLAIPEAVTPPSSRPSPGNTARPWGFGVAGGLLGGSGGGASATFQAEVEKRLGAQLLIRLAGGGAGERSLRFSGGEATWRRFFLLPTVGYGWRFGSLFADAAAGPVGALLRAQGRGFPTQASDTAIDVGGAAAIRIGGRLGRLPVALWGSGSALLWLRNQRAVIDGSDTSVTLPRADATFIAGLTFFFAS